MFNRGITELLRHLPAFDGLEGAVVKRQLTRAYLEGLDMASLAEEGQRERVVAELRRLATALEIHAIFVPDVAEETRRACAFVAAEALSLLSGLDQPDAVQQPFAAFGSRTVYRSVEAALLYLIAAFDANAAVAVRGLTPEPSEAPESQASAWALHQILALVRLGSPPVGDFPVAAAREPAGLDISSRVRVAMWHRIGESCRGHLRWLRLEDDASESPAAGEFAELVTMATDGRSVRYADVAHLASLLRLACEGTSGRALRRVPPPDDAGPYTEYLQRRARSRPVLWPSAERYSIECLPGPHAHAAVAMPTGAGKSGLAELAVAQALGRGWVLYLAPTRALVGQVRRDLRSGFGGAVVVREFLGGAEFTALADETLEVGAGPHVLVMTPEKCSLALRQSPGAFAALSLCVFDECHLIGDPRNRGVLSELVVSQVLQLAPDATMLMQSALLANPEDLKRWLETATGRPCVAIREPWRPTRTLRAVAGFDSETLIARRRAGEQELDARPSRRNWSIKSQLDLLVNLQGAWSGSAAEDYAVAKMSLEAPLTVTRHDDGTKSVPRKGYVNAATGALAQGLAEVGYRVLAFLPSNKHYSFSVARDLVGFGDVSDPGNSRWDELEWRLDIADYELGVPSVLRGLLRKGIGVHTSAMLQPEQRATELAYDYEFAQVVFATGTLAQGLNLPATAVVIGGITVGFEPDLSPSQRSARAQSQLLNAVGRAGRAYVAARSLAVVLPNEAYAINTVQDSMEVRAGAPFLEREDASSPVRSQLDHLVDRVTHGALTVETLGPAGLAAFSFLPLYSDASEATEILRRSYAVAGRGKADRDHASDVANAMVGLGTAALERASGPQWLVEVAYASGVSLRPVVAMWQSLGRIGNDELPTRVRGWAELLVAVLEGMPYPIVGEVLRLKDLDATEMAALASEESSHDHHAAWQVFATTVDRWLAGDALTTLAGTAVRPDAVGNGGRGSGNPLPKIIGLTEQLLVFQLSRLGGCLALLIEVADTYEPNTNWTRSRPSARALEQLSIAIRAGCDDGGSLAWWRFGGIRQRRLAHLAASLVPVPSDVLDGDDGQQREWLSGKRQQLLEPDVLGGLEPTLSADAFKALTALALLADGER